MSKCLDLEGIKGAKDHDLQKVEVPEWGGHVFVRTMSGIERDQFEQWCQAHLDDMTNIRGVLAALTVVDANGARLFTREDAQWLGEKSAKALNRVAEKAQDMNGLSSADIEDLEKN
jgi:hypothetical protein